MKSGFFGDLFDLNGDGELDMGEQFMDYMAFEEVMKSDEDPMEDTDIDSDDSDF